MRSRGEFSPIARVLLDGPDYQDLSPVARHAFLTLKVSLGPSGIEVRYPDALHVELAHRTGWTIAEITPALSELQDGGWVEVEQNVVWVVGQLEFHPNMTPDNPKHRAGIQRHIAGLPRLAIVRRFIERYASYFSGIEGPADAYPTAPDSLCDTHSDGIRNPIDSRSTNTNTNTNTNTHDSPSAKRVGEPDGETQQIDAVLAHYVGIHPRRRPGARDRAAVRRGLRAGYSVAELSEAIDGNAHDAWHKKERKHELTYVLRDNGLIDTFREKSAASVVASNGKAPADLRRRGYVGG